MVSAGKSGGGLMTKSHRTGGHGHEPAVPCRNIAAMVGQLVYQLVIEQARDGVVRVEDLKRVLALVSQGSGQLDRQYKAQQETCTGSLRANRRHVSSRSNAFQRLMVRPFETLLTSDPPGYPRAVLGNYFEVLAAAFGDKLTEYDRHCKAIFQALLVSHGNNLDWDVFFTDPRAIQVLAHALKRLMRFLDSPAGQWAWVQSMTRPNPSGARPTDAQADAVRQALESTVLGLGLGVPAAASAPQAQPSMAAQ